MNSSSASGVSRSSTRGFSLVEVVLAIGIVSFALLAVMGIFGGLMKSSDENTQRREIAEAVDSLRRELRQSDFETAYQWVREGKTLYYLAYHAGDSNIPDPNSPHVAGKWFESPPVTNLALMEAARSGRWVRAQLKVSPSNPGGTNLPGISSNYSRASVLALVLLDSVSSPNQTATNSGQLETSLSITR